MKQKITLLALLFTSFFYGQTTAIPDSNFEQALVDLNIDSNGMNGNILNSDAQAVTSLDVSSKNISTLTGIEAFVNLETFYASSNALTTINVTNNTLLEDLRVNNNSLTTLDISNNINVSILWAHFNNISTIDLTNNGALSELFLAFNRVTTFDATNLPNLTRLGISNGQAGFKLNSLNVQNNPLLNHLSIQGSELTSLNLSNNNLIKYLLISNNLLSGNLDLANMSNLIDFSAENNDFESINLKNSNNTNLSGVDVTNNPNLTCIQVDDVSYANAQSQWIKDAIAFYSEDCNSTDLIAIPDANFEQALIDAGVDTNGFTGNILKIEAEAATGLNLSNKNITDLTGINAFINLTYLSVSNNAVGNSLDISNITSLVTLSAYASNLTGVLDLSGNTNLKNLFGDNNAVTSVSFSSSNLIENINLDSSNLSSIDVSNFSELYQLDVGGNPALANLDVTQNPKLKLLSLENTQVTAVNLTQNPLLEFYFHSGVVLTSLDVSANPILKQLNVFNCQLTTLDLTNNLQLERIWMGGNKMSSFDYTIFPNLKVLNVFQPSPGFEFTSIDLSSNLDLETLVLSFHKITTLDLSNHNKLTQVFMYDNELTSFNIKNGVNNILQNLSTSLNPNLACVQVDNPAQADTNVTNGVWYKDAATTYSADCSVLGNEDFESIDPSVKVYPNPVKEVLNISAKDPITSVKLTDVNGKTILNSRSNIDKINVSSFKSGMYFLEIKTDKGVSNKKIIKQ